ncbi:MULTISPECIES: CPBP family intramembrane glutamic endopeptidase [Kocuria]|uniref:CPBP family intramembrane metalloprotease n=1 Tax=Kocuria subflava TaxID=1736139 RepID=A0A846TT19_9MICC|nr:MULTISPECIES: CPBP family intramembrane glutamic endopeptidase [Kocuria]NKE09949.1 CPBP family intramembrane metalloprotease [Kocuria subflava]
MRGLQRLVRDRPLAAVLATLVAGLFISMRMAIRDWPWEAVFFAQPVVVLLIWFIMAKRNLHDLGFHRWDQAVGSAPAVRDSAMGADIRSGAQRPRAFVAALVVAGLLTGISGAVFLMTGATTPMGVWLPRAAFFGALGAVVIGCLATALPEELVYRGVLVRLTENKWPLVGVILLSGALFSAAHAPNLAAQNGSATWIGLRFAELLIFGCVLAWAAVRTGSLWVPLGWHMGSNLAGVFIELVWVPQTVALWPVALTSMVLSLGVIPLVLFLERHPAKAVPVWHPRTVLPAE